MATPASSLRLRLLTLVLVQALASGAAGLVAAWLLYASVESRKRGARFAALARDARAFAHCLSLAARWDGETTHSGSDYVALAVVQIVGVVVGAVVHLAAWRVPEKPKGTDADDADGGTASGDAGDADDARDHPTFPFPPPRPEEELKAYNGISLVWKSAVVDAADGVLLVGVGFGCVWFPFFWCFTRLALVAWTHDQKGGLHPHPGAPDAIALQVVSFLFAALNVYLYRARRRAWFMEEKESGSTPSDRRPSADGEEAMETPLLGADDDATADSPSSAAPAEVTPGAQLVKLFRLAAPDWYWYTAAFVFLVLAVVCETALPTFTANATYYLLLNHESSLFWQNVVRCSLAACGVGLFSALRGGTLSYQNQRLVIRLQETLFAALLERNAYFFDTNPVGKLLSRLTTDTNQLGDVIGLNLNVAIRSILKVVFCVGYLSSVNWRITTLILATCGIFYGLSGIYGKYVRAYAKATQELTASANHIAEQAMSLFKTVKSHEAEVWEFRRFRTKNTLRLRVSLFQATTYGIYTLLYTVGTENLIALVLVYGYYLLRHNLIDLHNLTVFLFYVDTLVASVLYIADMFTDIMKALGASEEVFQLVDDALAEADFSRGGENLVLLDQYRRWTGWRGKDEGAGEGRHLVVAASGGDGSLPASLCQRGFKLAFDNVFFEYPKSVRPVLDGMSWTCESGRSLALCGASGSGKSTTITLIMRYYDPSGGRILVNDCDVMAVGLQGCTAGDITRWIRARVSLVSQEPPLFSTSIRDNIAYASATMDDRTVARSARVANALAFVENMPLGFATLCGPRGARLSGGQKQRVAIARAVAKNPDCLLLDEATSALDAESEQLVQASLEHIMVGRTTVTIAHRLSTIRAADTICTVDSGRVVESGTHDSLLSREGAYYRLVERQLHGSSARLDALAP